MLYDEENLYDLIQRHVIPKWQKYLLQKFNKGDSGNVSDPRPDTIWKKILRDVREFYRILFRVRFHYLDFKDCKGAKKCVEIMFEELGIPLQPKHLDDFKLFTYIHQSHKSTSRKLFRSSKNNDEGSPFGVIEQFNDASRRKFMTDPLGSKLFYFVFNNYLEHYVEFINPKYRFRIVTTICLVLKCYKKMKERSHMERIGMLLN